MNVISFFMLTRNGDQNRENARIHRIYRKKKQKNMIIVSSCWLSL